MQLKLKCLMCTFQPGDDDWVCYLLQNQVFNIFDPVFFMRRLSRTGHFRMDSINFSVASGIDSGPFIFVPRPWMPSVKKLLHVAIDFTLTFHGHVALTTNWNTNNRTSFVWFFTFALYFHLTRSRIDVAPALDGCFYFGACAPLLPIYVN